MRSPLGSFEDEEALVYALPADGGAGNCLTGPPYACAHVPYTVIGCFVTHLLVGLYSLETLKDVRIRTCISVI